MPRHLPERPAAALQSLRRLIRGARRSSSPPLPLQRTIPAERILGPATTPLRIVIVSQYFPPEVGATQSRMQAFAEYLAGRGHRVTVICEFPNHPHGTIPPRYRGRFVEIDRSNPYTVIRTWVKANPEKTQATRLAFYLSFMALATAAAPLAGRADVVLATSPPLFTGLAGLAIARLNAAPFVLDVRDLWPAAATSLGQISTGFPTAASELLERQLYRSATATVSVTRPFCEHIDLLRRRLPQTVLVPNATVDLFFELPAAARRPDGVPVDAFLVTFAGTLGIAQALPSVLDAAERLRDEAHFAFVGEGPTKRMLEDDARSRGLSNVSFHPQVPLERITGILAASDALLVPLSAHPTFRSFVPSKMIDFMATGKPLLVSAAGEAARIVASSGAGIAVPPEDPAALADAVRRLRTDRAAAARMRERGPEFARKRMRAEQAARLEHVLVDVVRRPRR